MTARWFEVLTVRDGVTHVLEALASTDAVQIESTASAPVRALADAVRRDLAACDRLARRFQRYWPRELITGGLWGLPGDVLRQAHVGIATWAAQAEPIVEALELLEREREDLELFAELARGAPPAMPALGLLAAVGPVLDARIWLLTRPVPEVAASATTVIYRVDGEAHEFVVAIGSRDDLDRVAYALEPTRPRALVLPAVLRESTADATSAIADRRRAVDRERASLTTQLRALAEAHVLDRMVGHLAQVRWFLDNVPPLEDTQHFVCVTGWTRDPSGRVLRQALENAGRPALLEFPTPPGAMTPPIVLDNPGWGRPFELFVRLLGMPSTDEVDPSVLLAVVVPLLFGFMFGDVGQGAVVLALGLILGRRLPATRILVPAGLAAMGFGVLFGSVFTAEHLLSAAWIHPLSEPVLLLAVSVGLGAVILALGLVLQGLSAAWGGRLPQWLRTDAALPVTWLGLLGMVLDPRLGWLAAAGVSWNLVGAASLVPTKRVGAALSALGGLAEGVLQLAVNTVSFARVGAFCLAHAGLSAAVHTLAVSADHVFVSVLVLVVGNALAIALEGLAVSIQTTRLVLFEFFTRFLRARGRPFRALRGPPTLLTQTRKKVAA